MFSLSRIIRTCSSKGRLVHSFITSTTPANKTQSLVLPQIAAAQNNWIYRENDKIHLPLISNITNIELPNGKIWVPPISEPTTGQDIVEAPSSNSSDTVIEAARLITIRKKKMKKHKLRKLRKRLKFERAKIRQRRELRKEKEFQAGLIQQCKEAEAFSAEAYVEERIRAYKEVLASFESVQNETTKVKHQKHK